MLLTTTRWCQVSKKNNAKNFLFKGYPLKHILKGKLWSFLQKPKFTGALGDYRSTGRWFGTMISMAMYQLIGSWIHLEFLESDVPFSKTYKSLWMLLFYFAKLKSRHKNTSPSLNIQKQEKKFSLFSKMGLSMHF